MKKAGITVIAVVILVVLAAGIVEGKDSRGSEQTEFSAEDNGVRKPVSPPKAVLEMLKNDEAVRDILESERVAPEQIPSSWFSASLAHLSNQKQPDIIVMGEGELRGANVITFWVFRTTSHGYELALKAPAHDLRVLKTRWRDYREIELISLTAEVISTTFCRFDGKRYVGFKATSEPIKPSQTRL